jgi:transcriptional regulator with XRE-family HTH domain
MVIRDYMNRPGTTWDSAAERLGISRSSLSAYRGRKASARSKKPPRATTPPSLDHLRRICDETGDSADWILFGTAPRERVQLSSRTELERALAQRLEQEVPERVADAWPQGRAEPVFADGARILENAINSATDALREYLATEASSRAENTASLVRKSLLEEADQIVVEASSEGTMSVESADRLTRIFGALAREERHRANPLRRPPVYPASSVGPSEWAREYAELVRRMEAQPATRWATDHWLTGHGAGVRRRAAALLGEAEDEEKSGVRRSSAE